jgi:class 3 adenylate cyclase/tetratricopeptide (TPR) repeat protein
VVSERRVVTILFSDIAGSTAAAGELDPEEWAEIANQILACMIGPIERYGGTVARLLGDAVLAFFGAPEAHEDDPERAVWAGLEIAEGMRELQADVSREHGVDFGVRVGINTGLVVVGEFGAHGRVEYTAMGDAINLAARMEQTAEPGTVQIAHGTFQLLGPQFDVEPLGDVEIKGKPQPEPVYRVRGIKGSHGRRRSNAAVRSQLVGRDREAAILDKVLSDLRHGRGQIVFLIGEAGLGKSRLVSELQDRWMTQADTEADLWVEVEAASYDSSQPYLLFRKAVQSLAGIEDRDTPEAIAAKVEKFMADLPLEHGTRHVEAITGLVAGVGRGAGPPDRLQIVQAASESVMRELHAANLDIWRSLAMSRRVVLVLEDVHWADTASIDLLRHLFEISERAPILFLCTFRPERRSPAWSLKTFVEVEYSHRYSEISLVALQSEETVRMVSGLLSHEASSEELRDLVLQRSEGNPLFVEEIIRMLIDQEVLVRDTSEHGTVWRLAPDAHLAEIEIPNSLRALVLERIDRLDPEVRRTLQLASVIGRTFSARVLEAVCEAGGDLQRHLEALLRVGLIRESGWHPDREYRFHHALIHEVTYRTALRRQRRDDHRRVGEAIETLYGDRLHEFAPILGHHFAEAADPRAPTYFALAGDATASLYANRDAVAHYTRALSLLGDDARDQMGDISLRCGVVYARLGAFEDALRHLDTALRLARDGGDQRTEQAALHELAGLYTSRDYTVAGRLADDALGLARRLGDSWSEGRALNRLGNIYSNQLKIAEALDLHQQALRVFNDLADQWGVADCLDLIGIAHVLSGNLSEAESAFSRAAVIFAELKDIERLASTTNNLAIIAEVAISGPCSITRPLDVYRAHAERGLELSQQIEWRPGEAFAMIALANISLAAGQFDIADRHAAAALDVASEIDHKQWIIFAVLTHGVIQFEMLDPEKALTYLEQAAEIANVTSLSYHEASVKTLIARCQWLLGNHALAQGMLDVLVSSPHVHDTVGQQRVLLTLAEIALQQREPDRALHMLDRMSFDPSYPPAAISFVRGQALANFERFEDADVELLRARQTAEEIGPRTLLWTIASVRATLWRQRDARLAEREDEVARQELDALAASISDLGRRTRFLDAASAHWNELAGLTEPVG